jgi:7-cyano-7-deazaguanine synthase
MKKQAVLSLSGGMDSSTLLLHLLNYDYHVTCVSFDYGQKHKVELERAQSLVDYLKTQGFENDVTYQVIKLDGLSQLLNSTLVTGGLEVPEGHYADDNMKATVVPNRNKIFSSITQAIALSIAEKHNCFVDVAMGIHAGDHEIYPDCRAEFRDADLEAFKLGNWGSEKVNYYTPYLFLDKTGILDAGYEICRELEIDFNEVYKRTNTSYKPIYIEYPMGSTMEDMRNGPEGVWYSDYKSASSVERIEAFIKLGLKDPVEYADSELGPVSWEYVVEQVTKVLDECNK